MKRNINPHTSSYTQIVTIHTNAYTCIHIHRNMHAHMTVRTLPKSSHRNHNNVARVASYLGKRFYRRVAVSTDRALCLCIMLICLSLCACSHFDRRVAVFPLGTVFMSNEHVFERVDTMLLTIMLACLYGKMHMYVRSFHLHTCASIRDLLFIGIFIFDWMSLQSMTEYMHICVLLP
jgi:hypothetical protein